MAGTNFYTPISATCWIALTEAENATLGVQRAMLAKCLGTPPTTANTFEHGCLMTQTDSSGAALYENTGTFASPTWTLVGTSAPGTLALTNTHILVGNASNLATDVALSGDATLANTGALTVAAGAITTAKIAAANVTLATLAAGITPSHVVKFAGTSSAFGGGGTSFAITVTGALATDVASAVIRASTTAVAIAKATLTSNTLTITFSADPGTATTIDYSILRAAS